MVPNYISNSNPKVFFANVTYNQVFAILRRPCLSLRKEFAAYCKAYKDAIYCIGSVAGPHPFPMMVRDFQSVVGIEARKQFLDMTGELPDAVVACVVGGSNAMGLFSGFLNDPVDIYGVEPLWQRRSGYGLYH